MTTLGGRCAVLCLTILAAGLDSPARGDSVTLTQAVSAELAPAAKLAVPATVTLVSSGATFQQFAGTLAISYRVRTSAAGGGTISLEAVSDFSPAGGPSVAANSLVYTCSGGTLGSACSGRQTAVTGTQSPVLALPAATCTGGGGVCSTTDPNSVQVTFSLDDDSSIGTGTYASQIMFVISAI